MTDDAWKSVGPCPRVGIVLLLTSALVVLQSGCLVTSSYNNVQRKSEPIQQVQFESDFARDVFQSHAQNSKHRESESSSFFFGIPFLLGLSYTSKPSSNAYYNDWVDRVDSDQNGLISEHEVASLGAPFEADDDNSTEINPGIIRISLGDKEESVER